MSGIAYVDHRDDPAAWARALGVSREAVELYLASDVIDLHVDSFIWTRILGYDLRKRHGHGVLGARFYSQVDFPRALEAQLSGAMWSITTHPLRSARARAHTFVANVAKLRGIVQSVGDQLALVRSHAEYVAARAQGKHAVFLAVQGGNALDADESTLALLDDSGVIRVTLVHLSSSRLGATSSPLRLGADAGLTRAGRRYIEGLNQRRVFVDLAHISRRGFFDALDVHDKAQPLIVTHTGVSAVHRSWRNLDDDQIRAVAETGGTIGVIFHGEFLGGSYLGGGRAVRIVDHLEHIVATVGEDHASLGSDFDGAIIPPADLRTCLELPRLVQLMLDRKFAPERVRKILGGNFLRTLRQLRG
ncbi:MAG TPA: membrane dipeptidase [Polyangiales bacterium]